MSALAILADPFPPVTPMGAHMLECERAEGREPITPDNLPDWVNISDWSPWPVLAVADGELHIIAVAASQSAQPGALRRLIDGAATAGLSPVVVEPIGPTMPAILKAWGWAGSSKGSGWERREEWRPA